MQYQPGIHLLSPTAMVIQMVEQMVEKQQFEIIFAFLLKFIYVELVRSIME